MPAPLTDAHLPLLQALSAAGFELVALPRFPGYVAAKKYDCAVLLEPLEDGGLRRFTAVGYLIEGNLAVRVQKGGEEWFVWKARQVRATPELLAAVRQFEADLAASLGRSP
ncbi:MAG TPA: hypothetical protein VNN18_01140 [Candidatus Xenobia bacterium]|nr:hypothetical protein [Candidatus Xenobia bacterium]